MARLHCLTRSRRPVCSLLFIILLHRFCSLVSFIPFSTFPKECDRIPRDSKTQSISKGARSSLNNIGGDKTANRTLSLPFTKRHGKWTSSQRVSHISLESRQLTYASAVEFDRDTWVGASI